MTEKAEESWKNHPSYLRAAAWVPDADENAAKWDELERRAVTWIQERAVADGVAPLVFFNAQKAYGGPGPIQTLASRSGYSYPLDRSSVRGAVLAVSPDARSLRKASGIARGSSLVIIEGTSTPLAGWAAGVGATDLSGLYDQPPTIHPDAKAALDHAIFFTGRNNWTGSHERDHARKVLAPVVRAGAVDADLALGYALAHDAVTETGAKNLHAIITKLSG